MRKRVRQACFIVLESAKDLTQKVLVLCVPALLPSRYFDKIRPQKLDLLRHKRGEPMPDQWQRNWPEISRIVAARVICGDHPYRPGRNAILAKWPVLKRSTFRIEWKWGAVRQEFPIHSYSGGGQLDSIARHGHNRFHQRFGSVRAISFSTVGAVC